MSRDNPLRGRTTHPRRIADAWTRTGRIDRRQVHGTIPTTALAGLEDLPANHAVGIASLDLLVVRTISFKLLYGQVTRRHALQQRRRVTALRTFVPAAPT